MKKQITDAVEILDRRYYTTDKRRADLEAARLNAAVARLVYDMRTEANLSQTQLAKLAGTTQSVISRLEDDDYHGHSLSILSRIAVALNKRLVLTAIPA
jgi:DNA-binding XRE family transcriptional regulator